MSYSLHIHDLNFSSEDLVVNPEAFPEFQLDDVVEIVVNVPDGEKKEPSGSSLFLQITSLAPVKVRKEERSRSRKRKRNISCLEVVLQH